MCRFFCALSQILGVFYEFIRFLWAIQLDKLGLLTKQSLGFMILIKNLSNF